MTLTLLYFIGVVLCAIGFLISGYVNVHSRYTQHITLKDIIMATLCIVCPVLNFIMLIFLCIILVDKSDSIIVVRGKGKVDSSERTFE